MTLPPYDPPLSVNVVRWVFTDPADALDTWTFEINPATAGSFERSWNANVGRSSMTGLALVHRLPQPTSTSFSGRLRTRTMYATLQSWIERSIVIHLTDHLLRTWQVILTGMEATQERARYGVPWYHPYTVHALVLGEVA